MKINGRDLTPQEQEVFDAMCKIAHDIYLKVSEEVIMENPGGKSIDDFLAMLIDEQSE